MQFISITRRSTKVHRRKCRNIQTKICIRYTGNANSCLGPTVLETIIMSAENFNAKFTNATVVGASNFEMINSTFDIANYSLIMNVRFPYVHLDSNYRIDGKLLVLQLKSNGKCWLNASNVDGYIEINGKLRKENDKTYLDFNDRSKNKIKLNIKDKPAVYFADLFKGSEELTKTTNAVINDNIVQIMEDFMPIVNEIIGSFVFTSIQTIFNTFSMEELFLP
ncbi:uncharacterized protein [Atheta coriaria]|uniref:uncharacterized protein n=1 Tax=Dalotia coriaria TaxID=877792 RepID=UPI0031F35589